MNRITDYQRALRDLTEVAQRTPRNRAEHRRQAAIRHRVLRYCNRADKRAVAQAQKREAKFGRVLGAEGSDHIRGRIATRLVTEVNQALELRGGQLALMPHPAEAAK